MGVDIRGSSDHSSSSGDDGGPLPGLFPYEDEANEEDDEKEGPQLLESKMDGPTTDLAQKKKLADEIEAIRILYKKGQKRDFLHQFYAAHVVEQALETLSPSALAEKKKPELDNSNKSNSAAKKKKRRSSKGTERESRKDKYRQMVRAKPKPAVDKQTKASETDENPSDMPTGVQSNVGSPIGSPTKAHKSGGPTGIPTEIQFVESPGDTPTEKDGDHHDSLTASDEVARIIQKVAEEKALLERMEAEKGAAKHKEKAAVEATEPEQQINTETLSDDLPGLAPYQTNHTTKLEGAKTPLTESGEAGKSTGTEQDEVGQAHGLLPEHNNNTQYSTNLRAHEEEKKEPESEDKDPSMNDMKELLEATRIQNELLQSRVQTLETNLEANQTSLKEAWVEIGRLRHAYQEVKRGGAPRRSTTTSSIDSHLRETSSRQLHNDSRHRHNRHRSREDESRTGRSHRTSGSRLSGDGANKDDQQSRDSGHHRGDHGHSLTSSRHGHHHTRRPQRRHTTVEVHSSINDNSRRGGLQDSSKSNRSPISERSRSKHHSHRSSRT